MKIFNLILIVLLSVVLLSGSAEASFIDNFNDPTFADWPFVAGAWSDSGSMGATGVPAQAYRTNGYDRNPTYIGFYLNRTGSVAANDVIQIYENSGGAVACRLTFTPNTGVLTGLTGIGGAVCPATSSVTIPFGALFKLENTVLSPTQFQYVVTNTTSGNNTIVVNQVVAGNPFNGGVTNADRVRLSFATTSTRLQTFVVSNVTPTTSTSISWGANSYVQGDTASFSWSITDSDWNNPFNLWHVRVTDQSGNEYNFQSFYTPCLCFTQFGLPTQTGSYSLLTTALGTFTVHLDSFFANDVSTDTINVMGQSSAFIIINASVPYHTQVPAQYNFGFGGVNLNDAIQTFYLDPNTNTYQFEHSFFGLSSGTNTRNVYFEKVGTYILRLRDLSKDVTYAQTTTTTTFAAPETTLNITKTTINITKNNYGYGDTIFGNYTIDSTNWTAGQVYLDVFNWDQGIVTTQMQGTGTGWVDISTAQVGNILVQLLNVPANQNFAQTTFIAGNNSLRIMLKNTTGVTNVLAFTNFTMSNCNVNGYCLVLSKYSVLTNEKFFAYATVPESGAKLVLINTGSDLKTGKLLSQLSSTASNPISVPISISNAGNYAIVILNPANDSEAMQNVVVITAAVTPTSTISPQQAGNQVANDVTTLLTSLAFWAFLIVAGIMMYIGWKTRNYIPASIAGISGLGVFTWIGWVPAWIFFSVLVITAYLLAKNQVSGETDTGQNK